MYWCSNRFIVLIKGKFLEFGNLYESTIKLAHTFDCEWKLWNLNADTDNLTTKLLYFDNVNDDFKVTLDTVLDYFLSGKWKSAAKLIALQGKDSLLRTKKYLSMFNQFDNLKTDNSDEIPLFYYVLIVLNEKLNVDESLLFAELCMHRGDDWMYKFYQCLQSNQIESSEELGELFESSPSIALFIYGQINAEDKVFFL